MPPARAQPTTDIRRFSENDLRFLDQF